MAKLSFDRANLDTIAREAAFIHRKEYGTGGRIFGITWVLSLSGVSPVLVVGYYANGKNNSCGHYDTHVDLTATNLI